VAVEGADIRFEFSGKFQVLATAGKRDISLLAGASRFIGDYPMKDGYTLPEVAKVRVVIVFQACWAVFRCWRSREDSIIVAGKKKGTVMVEVRRGLVAETPMI